MQEIDIKNIPSNRLQFFPVMMFAMIMGLSGLTLVFKKAHEVFALSSIFATLLSYFTIILFIIVFTIYLFKIFLYTNEVKKELSHPIRINFFASISISLLLLSMIFQNINSDIAYILFLFGAILQIFFTFFTLSFWVNSNIEISHSNPAWFIPIVGNLIVPIAGVLYFSQNVLMFYFSIGLFFWIILFSIVFNRLIFHKQFAPKFMPTLFILIAPPSIGFLSYMKMFESLDLFANILYSLGLFFTLFILFMYKNFLKIKFFISWWAFTFPLATISLATLKIFSLTNDILYLYLSYILILSLSIIVLIVLYNTVKHMLKKEICIME